MLAELIEHEQDIKTLHARIDRMNDHADPQPSIPEQLNHLHDIMKAMNVAMQNMQQEIKELRAQVFDHDKRITANTELISECGDVMTGIARNALRMETIVNTVRSDPQKPV